MVAGPPNEIQVSLARAFALAFAPPFLRHHLLVRNRDVKQWRCAMEDNSRPSRDGVFDRRADTGLSRQRSENATRAASTSPDDAILSVDAGSLTILDANAASGALFACSLDELVGKPLCERLVSRNSCRVLFTLIDSAWRAGHEDLTLDYWFMRRDGTPFIVTLTVARAGRQGDHDSSVYSLRLNARHP